MSVNSDIHIRPATIEDKEFIVSLVPRLTEFGPPDWRDADKLNAADVQVLSDTILNPPAGAFIFVAEDADGVPLGFIHLRAGTDYYNRKPHGHISDVIVAPEAKGRGVGRLLMEKAEEWAREQGYKWLTLSVFAQNQRARELYERLGYGEDIMKYVKELA